MLFERGSTILEEYVLLAGGAPCLGRGSLLDEVLVHVKDVVSDVVWVEDHMLAHGAAENPPHVHDDEVRAHGAPLHELAAVLAH